MTPEPNRIEVPDGRSLDVYVDGPADGVPLVSHHGTPSAGVPFGPFVRAAAERGMRWVSYSRPGYGSSTRHEGRSVADCVGDIVAILDHLREDRFYTTGGSGGGPHTLACAALLPDRVLACAAIAAVAPRHASGLDWTGDMGPRTSKSSARPRQAPTRSSAISRVRRPACGRRPRRKNWSTRWRGSCRRSIGTP